MQTIGPKDIGGWLTATSQRHRRALLRAFRRAAALSESFLKRRTSSLRPYPPVHTGEYKRRWRHESLLAGARVYNEAPYAGIIELGVRRGRVPLPRRGARGGPRPMRALLRWTYLKFRHREGWRNEGEAWGRAVAVQTALHYRGMAGRRVMTAPEARREMVRITRDAVRAMLAAGG